MVAKRGAINPMFGRCNHSGTLPMKNQLKWTKASSATNIYYLKNISLRCMEAGVCSIYVTGWLLNDISEE